MLLVVIAVGLALRLVGAGARLSHDEGYSWLVATAPTAEAFFDRMAAFENTPPLFYALLAVLPHDSEGWLRVVSIVAGTLWIPLTYAIGRTLYGPRGALLAALMVAVVPFAVSYSDYSRAFMLAGLGLLIALRAASKLITGTAHERRWSAVFVLGAAVALWSEYYSLAFLGAFVVALLMVSPVPYPHLTKGMLRGRKATPLLLIAAILLVLARELALVLMFWGYALGGLVNHVAARVAARGEELALGLDDRMRQ